ncbi:hypothetical protein D3C74_21410 [compost metagenome]
MKVLNFSADSEENYSTNSVIPIISLKGTNIFIYNRRTKATHDNGKLVERQGRKATGPS